MMGQDQFENDDEYDNEGDYRYLRIWKMRKFIRFSYQFFKTLPAL